eukprot:TRINITY_DN114_c10_g1_i1.p1 TRINITY_DN114_c10_g1~~TRINITY_DN114_c10_g1_i1.p1  ORF type:complete len:917 (+),score=194.94 TRINITY_DN114_c10_g1_i1:38-2752(+)
MQPSQQELEQIVVIFKAGANAMDQSAVARATEFIQQHTADPKFNTALAVIASTPGCCEDEVRQHAALALKNCIKLAFEKGIEPNLATIKATLVKALSEKHHGTRQALACCVSDIAKTGSYPTLVQELWPQFAQSQDKGHRAGILFCIRDMCENCADQLEEGGMNCQATILIQELVGLLTSSSDGEEILFAIQALLSLLSHQSEFEESPIDKKCEQLLQPMCTALKRCCEFAKSGNSPSHGKVMEALLGCYRMIAQHYYGQLKAAGEIQHILHVIVETSSSNNQGVLLAACTFWYDLSIKQDAINDFFSIEGLMPKVVEQLFEGMHYSDMEIALIEEDELKENIQPRHNWKKAKKNQSGEDEAEVENWTVRTCTASVIDQLALVHPGFGALVFPQIQSRLSHANWKTQEVAFLALGAISNGCYEQVLPLLGQLVPLLFNLLRSQNVHFLVQTIAIWALSRYDPYFSTNEAHFKEYLSILLDHLSAPKRKVQEATISAFDGLMDQEARLSYEEIGGFLAKDPQTANAVMARLTDCLGKNYTTKNMTNLLNAVTHTVSAFPINTAEGMTFIRPIMELLPRTPDTEVGILPSLMNCVGNIVYNLSGDPQFVTPFYQKCLHILGKHMQQQFQYKGEVPDHLDMGQNPCMAIYCVNDLCSYANMDQLIQEKYLDFTFLDLVMMPLQQPDWVDGDLYLKALSFIGENLAVYPQLFVKSCQNIGNVLKYCEPEGCYKTCGDCCWFAGVLAITAPGRMSQDEINSLVGALANKIIPILIHAGVAKNEVHNVARHAALAVGKFGAVAPDLLASQLSSFYPMLVSHMIGILSGMEKIQACQGVMQLIKKNTSVFGDSNNIVLLGKLMHSCQFGDDAETISEFASTLAVLKNLAGDQWGAVAQKVSFPPAILARLQ